ncbi:MAG: hypothetical protein QNK04_32910 [Myxococcota bacterium]|nr:hypothetical protein [Myxococcota bacterium]
MNALVPIERLLFGAWMLVLLGVERIETGLTFFPKRQDGAERTAGPA